MTAFTDDQLDALARELPAVRPEAARLEQVRTELLAAAGEITPLPARLLRGRTAVAILVPAAAAAALVVWLIAGRGGEPARSHAVLTPAADAELAQIGAPPDEIVHLRTGSLTVDVSLHTRTERFRVITSDAELEARSSRFVVAADHGRIASVEVTRGEVELRPASARPITVRAGGRWAAAPRVETAAAPAPAPTAVAIATGPANASGSAGASDLGPRASSAVPASPRSSSRSSGVAPGSTPPRKHAAAQPAALPAPPPAPAIAATPAPAAPAPPSAPGEAEFRAGWDALRRGDATPAAASFAASRRAAGHGSVGEDASFWEGVALARAGRAADAIAALRRFLAGYASSSRAGEASARLGWLLVDAGELDAAGRAFQAAASDRVPAVRRSAHSGLDKIAALRAP